MFAVLLITMRSVLSKHTKAKAVSPQANEEVDTGEAAARIEHGHCAKINAHTHAHAHRRRPSNRRRHSISTNYS